MCYVICARHQRGPGGRPRAATASLQGPGDAHRGPAGPAGRGEGAAAAAHRPAGVTDQPAAGHPGAAEEDVRADGPSK